MNQERLCINSNQIVNLNAIGYVEWVCDSSGFGNWWLYCRIYFVGGLVARTSSIEDLYNIAKHYPPSAGWADREYDLHKMNLTAPELKFLEMYKSKKSFAPEPDHRVVGKDIKFQEHLENASKIVAGWPEWMKYVFRKDFGSD